MLPPGRPGGLGNSCSLRGFRSFGRSWAIWTRKSEVESVFWGQAMIIYRSFCSSSIMVQPKLKEKDWKRNHHFVKVRYWDVLDVFGTFQFQDIWYVYICGFISWPFVLVPPKSTFNLARFSLLSRKTAEAAPSLQQNLGTLAFHFQKKEGGSRMGFSTTKMEGLGSLQTSKR